MISYKADRTEETEPIGNDTWKPLNQKQLKGIAYTTYWSYDPNTVSISLQCLGEPKATRQIPVSHS